MLNLEMGLYGADCTNSVISMTKIKYHSTVLLISLRLSKVESYIFVASLRGVKGDILKAE